MARWPTMTKRNGTSPRPDAVEQQDEMLDRLDKKRYKRCNVGIAIINHQFLMVYTTHKDGDEWGMVYDCYTNITCPQFLNGWEVAVNSQVAPKTSDKPRLATTFWADFPEFPESFEAKHGGTWTGPLLIYHLIKAIACAVPIIITDISSISHYTVLYQFMRHQLRLYDIILYYILLHHITLYYITLYYIMLHSITLSRFVILYCTILYYITLCYTILYSIVLYYIYCILYFIVLYCIVWCFYYIIEYIYLIICFY